MTWNPSPGANRYHVGRSPFVWGPFAPVASDVSANRYLDMEVESGGTYHYVVIAVNQLGESPDSDVVTVALPNPPPAPNLHPAECRDRRIVLQWDAVPGAKSYSVQRAESTNRQFRLVAGAVCDTRFEDTGVHNAKQYEYMVAAANPAGDGPPSRSVLATPIAAPGGATEFLARPTWMEEPVIESRPVAAEPQPADIAKAAYLPPGEATQFLNRLSCMEEPEIVPRPADTEIVEPAEATEVEPEPEPEPKPEPEPALATNESDTTVPESPSSLELEPGDGRIVLTWQTCEGAREYKIRRWTEGTDTIQLQNQTAHVNRYEDTGLANGVTFYYQISSVNKAGSCKRPVQGSAAPGTPPPPPRFIDAVPGNGEVVLTWEPSDKSVDYKVYRSLSARSGFKRIGAAPTADPFTDAGLKNGEQYYYRITAANAAGASEPSEILSATPTEPPATPLEVRIVGGDHKARLSWNAVKGAAGYNIWRRMSFEPELELVVEGYPGTEFEDRGLINGETYLYAVETKDLNGGSSRSALFETKPMARPAPPKGLRGEPGLRSVKLSWEKMDAETDYVVLRSETPTGPFSQVTVVRKDCVYVDRKLKNKVAYYYVVRAANTKGTSEDSNVAEATPALSRLFSLRKK